MVIPALAASLIVSGAAFAKNGVSGQPGIPAALTTVPDASASPTPTIPAPPPPSTTPTQTSVPPPAANPAPAPTNPLVPAHPASHPTSRKSPAPPVSQPPATQPLPMTPEPPPAPAPAPPGGKRSGASFYEPYLSSGDVLDREIEDLTAKVRAHPSDAGLRNDLGNLLARRGFAKEAADQYQKAAKLDPAFYLADYNEGLLWEKEGKPSSAIKAYERSIKRKPGFPLSRFHLAFLLEKEGRNEDAVREYAKALRIDPSLRWPARNPLAVQTRLLYRASIENYPRDLAGVDVADEASFADRAVWELLHPQRPVNTADLDTDTTAEEEPAPAAGGTGAPTSTPLIGGKPAPAKPADTRRQQLIDQFRRNRAARPPMAPQPVPPPTEVPAPAPPEDENAPNPAMQQEEPPPPTVAFARSETGGIPTAARLA
jgi:hypothetical protein